MQSWHPPQSKFLAELRKLPLLPDVDEEILHLHALLLEFDISISGKRPLKQSTTKQAQRELDAYRKALVNLTRATESLTPRALKTLALTWRQFEAPQFIPGVTPPRPLPKDHRNLLFALELAEHELRNLDTSPERGRRPNEQARYLARSLAGIYFDLTGERPTRRTDPYSDPPRYDGPFVDFVRACFDLSDLMASADEYARFAAEEFTTKGQKSN